MRVLFPGLMHVRRPRGLLFAARADTSCQDTALHAEQAIAKKHMATATVYRRIRHVQVRTCCAAERLNLLLSSEPKVLQLTQVAQT